MFPLKNFQKDMNGVDVQAGLFGKRALSEWISFAKQTCPTY